MEPDVPFSTNLDDPHAIAYFTWDDPIESIRTPRRNDKSLPSFASEASGVPRGAAGLLSFCAYGALTSERVQEYGFGRGKRTRTSTRALASALTLALSIGEWSQPRNPCSAA